jgi:hypothetical protein
MFLGENSVWIRRIGGRILEIPVWVVLDDDYIKHDAYGIDVLAALDAESSPSWIVANAVLQVSHEPKY